MGKVAGAEQRVGDFSKTLTAQGRLFTVHDDLTLYTNPAFDPTRAVTASNIHYLRQPFPGNIVPKNRMDPTALHVLGDRGRRENARGAGAAGLSAIALGGGAIAGPAVAGHLFEGVGPRAMISAAAAALAVGLWAYLAAARRPGLAP